MNRDDLLKYAETAMTEAKEEVLEKGRVSPTLIMVPGDNRSLIMTPAPDKNLVPPILKKGNRKLSLGRLSYRYGNQTQMTREKPSRFR